MWHWLVSQAMVNGSVSCVISADYRCIITREKITLLSVTFRCRWIDPPNNSRGFVFVIDIKYRTATWLTQRRLQYIRKCNYAHRDDLMNRNDNRVIADETSATWYRSVLFFFFFRNVFCSSFGTSYFATALMPYMYNRGYAYGEVDVFN